MKAIEAATNIICISIYICTLPWTFVGGGEGGKCQESCGGNFFTWVEGRQLFSEPEGMTFFRSQFSTFPYYQTYAGFGYIFEQVGVIFPPPYKGGLTFFMSLTQYSHQAHCERDAP